MMTIDPIDAVKDKILEIEDRLYREYRGVIFKTVVSAVEKPLIERALELTYGNQLRAARILGVNRNTIRSKIRKLGIDLSKWKEY